MTYVEFVDKTQVENICACLVRVPERVVLVGGDKKALPKLAKRYQSVLSERGHEVEFACCPVSRNKLENIVQKLSEIVEAYDDCVFDVTGGEDLMLVAVGIVRERYADKHIQLQRVNLYTNEVFDCDADGEVASGKVPALSVEENVRVYGGKVVFEHERKDTTYCWNMTEAFRDDIRAMWEICHNNHSRWNKQISTLRALSTCCAEGELHTAAPLCDVEIQLKKDEAPPLLWWEPLLMKLKSRGFITHYANDGATVEVAYRDAEIKRCLTKEGQVLEMKVYLEALECCDENGPAYNDVMTGVYIDWDGTLQQTSQGDTCNEIDVMMMYGVLPVFVSCKNGKVKMEELYKLNTVAERFGQAYARKVLVAPGIRGRAAVDLRERAEAMRIRVVDKLPDGSWDELMRSFRNTNV